MSNFAKYLMAAVGNSSAEAVLYKDAADYSHVRFDRMNLTGTDRAFGIFIHPEGTKFYLIQENTSIREMNLSTPYDISTRSSFTASLSFGTGNDGARSMFFKPDGTKLYISDIDDHLYEYTLTTAWDISTGSLTQSKDLQAPFNILWGNFFKPDGTKFWGCDPSLDRAKGFDLTTAWDISTINVSSLESSALLDVSPLSATGPRSLWWSNDGTKVYIVDVARDDVMMWNASTPWDTTAITNSTGDPDSVLDISSFENIPLSLCFSADGKYMYISGANGDGVDQFVRT